MKARVHVNQHNIRYNRSNPGDMKPVVTVKTYKSNEYGDTVEINGPSVVVYSPDKPLSCGAKGCGTGEEPAKMNLRSNVTWPCWHGNQLDEECPMKGPQEAESSQRERKN